MAALFRLLLLLLPPPPPMAAAKVSALRFSETVLLRPTVRTLLLDFASIHGQRRNYLIMPPPPSTGQYGAGGKAHGPSTFDKLKMGALMGGSVGLVVGFLFGGFNILRYGAGPNGYVRSVGQAMASSAAMFGFFMSIGTVIRTAPPASSVQWELAARHRRVRIYD